MGFSKAPRSRAAEGKHQRSHDSQELATRAFFWSNHLWEGTRTKVKTLFSVNHSNPSEWESSATPALGMQHPRAPQGHLWGLLSLPQLPPHAGVKRA